MNVCKRKATMLAVPIIAMMMILTGFFVVADDESDAVAANSYGSASEAQAHPSATVNISPGATWTYPLSIPDDLVAESKVSTDPLSDQLFKDTKPTITGLTVQVTIPGSTAAGDYRLVLKVYHEPTGQSAYQCVQFHVIKGLVFNAPTHDPVVDGTDVTITFAATQGSGHFTYDEKTNTSNLTFENGVFKGKVSGAGTKTFTVMATDTDTGKTATATATLVVREKLVASMGQDDLTLAGVSKFVGPVIDSKYDDLNITWAVTAGDLSGSGLNVTSSTGQFGGTPTKLVQNKTVTITGTTGVAPIQKTTYTVVVNAEPALTITVNNGIATFVGNSESKSVTVSENVTTSNITYTISNTGITGVSINADNGTVTVVNPNKSVTQKTVTVTATTALGQVKTDTFVLDIEDKITVSSPTSSDKMNSAVNKPATIAVTITNPSGHYNNIKLDTKNNAFGNGLQGTGNSATELELTLSGTVKVSEKGITVYITTANGQNVPVILKGQIYSQLVITEAPTNGTIAYPGQSS